MNKNSFVFYGSFAEAMEELTDEEYGKMCRIINNYALNDIEPEGLKGTFKMLFTLIKPQLDANKKRYECGAKGGRPTNKNNSYKEEKPKDSDKSTDNKPTDTTPEENKKPSVIFFDEKNKPNVNDNANENVNVNEFADKSAPTQLEPAESSPEEIPQGGEIAVPEPVIYLDLEKKQGTPEIIPENQLYFPEPEIIHVPEISHGSEKQPDKPEKPKRVPLREREPVNDMEIIEKCYLGLWDILYEDGKVKTPEPIIDWGKTRALEKQALEKYGFETVLTALNKAIFNPFVLQTGFDLSKLLSVGVLSGLINGSMPPKKSGQGMSVNDAIPADMIIY